MSTKAKRQSIVTKVGQPSRTSKASTLKRGGTVFTTERENLIDVGGGFVLAGVKLITTITVIQ